MFPGEWKGWLLIVVAGPAVLAVLGLAVAVAWLALDEGRPLGDLARVERTRVPPDSLPAGAPFRSWLSGFAPRSRTLDLGLKPQVSRTVRHGTFMHQP